MNTASKIEIDIEKRDVDDWYGFIRLENGSEMDVYSKTRERTIESLKSSIKNQINCLIDGLIELEKEK